MFDVTKIRKDFPILGIEVYKKPLIYFDNGATTQKPQCVINSIVNTYSLINANVHRGVHFLSQQSTEESEGVRKIVADFINAKKTNEIIFTSGTTESFNLLAHSFCQSFCDEGDEIILSEMEHHANIVPWQLQEEVRGIKIKVIPITEKGELNISKLSELISVKTKLISITHVSNVLGTINPIKEIIEFAHSKNIPVAIDAAQSIQHLKIDVQQLDCDFLAFSGHKIYGPTGVGVFFGKEKYLEKMIPYQGGGEMIKSVSFENTTFNELPFKFEAGTPNYVGIIGLGQAIKYVEEIGIDKIKAYEEDLLNYCTEKLRDIKDLKIYGEATAKSSVISFLVKGTHFYDIGLLLDKMGIAVRTGNHCAQPLMKALGIEGTVRIAFAVYNTREEIDSFIEALKKTIIILS